MVAVIELIGLYSDVNQEIIDKNMHSISNYFRIVTRDLQDIKSKLQSIPLVVPSAVQKDGPNGPQASDNPRF